MKVYHMDSNTHSGKVKDFHDWDAEQYRSLRYHSSSCEGLAYVTRKELVLSLIDIDSGKVLDIGCGPGILSSELLDRNFQVFSSDLSIEMIKQARQNIVKNTSASNAHFTVGSVNDISFSDNQFDLIFCIGVVCYIEDYNDLLSELYRVLKPGGKLIIQIDKILWPSLYQKAVPVYQYLKSKITSKKYDNINFVFTYFTYKKFINDLTSKGLDLLDMQCFDFRVPFLDIILPKVSLKLGKMMFENRHKKFFSNFAHGLILKAVKSK